jgi:hypothetical protein
MFVKSCSEHIAIVIRGIGSSSAITYSKGIHIYSRERERIIVYLVEFVEYFNNTINEQTHTQGEREKQLPWKDDI